MSERNEKYGAKITLNTDKPTLTVVVSTWTEFRCKVAADYKRLVGKDIDWEKSKFTLRWIYMTIGSHEIPLPIHATISPFSEDVLSDTINFDCLIKGKIVEK
jgi:hypothetical protein